MYQVKRFVIVTSAKKFTQYRNRVQDFYAMTLFIKSKCQFALNYLSFYLQIEF